MLSDPLSAPTLAPEVVRSSSKSFLARPVTYWIMPIILLGLEVITGAFVQFPILFVAPVALSAWFYSARWAYTLAVLLPLGRFFIADFLKPSELSIFIIANSVIEVEVLILLAFLVTRTARQTKALEARVAGLITMCAWSRTIQFEGEWVSFEEYLKRRFGLDTSHGISPTESHKKFGEGDLGDAPPE